MDLSLSQMWPIWSHGVNATIRIRLTFLSCVSHTTKIPGSISIIHGSDTRHFCVRSTFNRYRSQGVCYLESLYAFRPHPRSLHTVCHWELSLDHLNHWQNKQYQLRLLRHFVNQTDSLRRNPWLILSGQWPSIDRYTAVNNKHIPWTFDNCHFFHILKYL